MLNLNHRIAAISFSSIVHVSITVALSFGSFGQPAGETATFLSPITDPAGSTALTTFETALASPAPAPAIPVELSGSAAKDFGQAPATHRYTQQMLVVHRPHFTAEAPEPGASAASLQPLAASLGSPQPQPGVITASGGRTLPRAASRPTLKIGVDEIALLQPPKSEVIEISPPPEPEKQRTPVIIRGVMKRHLRPSQMKNDQPEPVSAAKAAEPAGNNRVDVRPRRISGRAPMFPLREMFRARSGEVLLNLYISATGRVTRVQVAASSGSALYDAAAISAANSWRYEPALRNGRAVPYVLQEPVRFVAGMRAF